MIDCIWWDECPLSSLYRGLRYCNERCSWYAVEMDTDVVNRRVKKLSAIKLKKLTNFADNANIANKEVDKNEKI